MPLHVDSSTNLEINKCMLWRNTKKCVVFENSCLKNFVNVQEKHPGEIAFLSKVAGYLTLTGNVFLGNFFCSSGKFSEQVSQETPANAGFCNKLSLEKVSTKIYFSKYISFDLIFNDMCSQGLSV